MTITTLPAPPSDSAVDAWHTVVRAAHLHDLPELEDAQREALLRENFRDVGIGLFEFARAWWGRVAPMRREVHRLSSRRASGSPARTSRTCCPRTRAGSPKARPPGGGWAEAAEDGGLTSGPGRLGPAPEVSYERRFERRRPWFSGKEPAQIFG